MPTEPAGRRAKAFTGFRWGRGDELVVFRTQIHARPSKEQREEALARAVLDDGEDDNSHEDQNGGSGNYGEHEKELGPVPIETISWDQIPAQMRRLVAIGQREFEALQEPNADVIACSRNLRKALDRSVSLLEASVGDNEDDPRAGYLEKMKDATAAWHLTELLILDQGPLVASDFVSWVAQHGPSRDPAGELDVKNRGTQSEYFWSEVISCTFRGDLLAAWRCLRLLEPEQIHSEEDQDLVRMLDELRALLLAMPRRAVYGADHDNDADDQDVLRDDDYELWKSAEMDADPDSLVDFKARSMRWKIAMQEFVRDNRVKILQVGPGLGKMLALICGDVDEAIQQIDSQKNSWLHLVACLLLYHVTAARKDELNTLVGQCIDALDIEKDERVNLLLSVVDMNSPEILQQLQSFVGDKWVTAHLAELLTRAGALETVMQPSNAEQSDFIDDDAFLLGSLEVDLREYFLLDYAMNLGLGGHQSIRNSLIPGTWRLTATYLGSLKREIEIPPHFAVQLGRLHMETIINLQRPVSDRFCHRLASGCNMLDIDPSSFIRQRMMYWWHFNGGIHNGLQGMSNALVWASKYSEHRFAERMLSTLFATSQIDILDSLVNHLAASQQLTQTLSADALEFLARYRSLLETMGRGPVYDHADVSRACEQLAESFAANLVPRAFYLPLLKKVLYASTQRPHLNAADASTLLAALEEVEIAHDRDTLLSGIETEELAELRIMLIQVMALSPIVAGH